jgi:chitodextrinase
MKHIRYISITILIAALVFAPLSQAQPARALEAATNCVTSSPVPATFTVTICLTNPADGSTLVGNIPVTLTASWSVGAPRIQRMVFYLDGAYLLTDYQTPYVFALPTRKWVDGAHVLAVEALMSTGFVSQRANIVINFNNGITTPPVNPYQFIPATGTTPAPGTPFTVAVGGDGASGETNATNVTNLIAAQNPNLFLYVGDVYEKGSSTEFYNWYGTPASYFGRFRSITNPTVGNHEYSSGKALGYFDYWNNVPPYYSYNAGGWHFISINSNSAFVPGAPTSIQYQWLAADLAANAGKCTIAYYHHPLFNIGPEGSKTSMLDMWKLMAQYGVDIVINGHDHDYQRWIPLNGSGVPDPNGITEFVVGASGHGTQSFIKTDSRVAYSNDVNPTAFGALFLQLNASGAHFSYRSTNGTVLDSGVIPCGIGAPDTQPPSVPGGLTATAASATQVNLSWSASTDNTGVKGYTVYRNGVSLATVMAPNLTYSDATVSPQTTYSYTVDAFDQIGNHSAQSAPAQVTTPAVPSSLPFLPDADTYVNAGSPTSIYGKASALRADATPDLHSYLRFTVSGLGGKTITHARLLIYANTSAAQGIQAFAVADNTWAELTTNYNNAPVLGGLLNTSPAATALTWVTLDLTGYITGEGTFNLAVATSSAVAVSLAARESGANAPRLILDLQ